MITMNNSAPPLVVKPELESLRHLLAILADPEKTKRRLEELTAAAEGLKAQMAAHGESHDKMAAALDEHRKQLRAEKARPTPPLPRIVNDTSLNVRHARRRFRRRNHKSLRLRPSSTRILKA